MPEFVEFTNLSPWSLCRWNYGRVLVKILFLFQAFEAALIYTKKAAARAVEIGNQSHDDRDHQWGDDSHQPESSALPVAKGEAREGCDQQ